MIYANIASIPERKEFLIKTVKSIYNQVDVINLYLNNYKENPFINDPKINVVFGDNSTGDAGKFFFIDKCDGYYFTMDDDLIYPENYVKDTIENYNDGVVTYHGRSFPNFPIRSYYNSANKRHHCMNQQLNDDIVQFGGTGVMMFHTSKVKLRYDMFKFKNMADVFVGVYCRVNKIEIKCLKHKKDFLTYQNVGKNTIFDKHNMADQLQTAIVNKYFK